MGREELVLRAYTHAADADFLFIEGVMGLFDGAAGGQGSTASLARALQLPILLILDVKGQAQTSAAIAEGLRRFDPELDIAGVILNRVGSHAHEMLLRQAFSEIDLAVLGAVPVSDDLCLPSRHLVWCRRGEHADLPDKIDIIADHVGQFVDLDLLVALGRSAQAPCGSETLTRLQPLGQNIAVAKDAAFTFLYPHILEDWREQGARLSFFSPIGMKLRARMLTRSICPEDIPNSILMSCPMRPVFGRP